MLSSKNRSRIVWLLPFLASVLMACGSFFGMSSVSDAALQEGPAGDMAGAAGALLFLICIVMGFVMSTITLLVTKLLRQPPPHQIAFRLVLLFVGGIIIGALEANPGFWSTVAFWLLLLGLPILLIWPSHLKVVPTVKKKIG